MPSLEPMHPSGVVTAPLTLDIRKTLDAPISQVWAAFAEPKTWTGWFPGMKSCAWGGTERECVGALRHLHLDAFRLTERITQWEPEKTWGMTVMEMNLPGLSSMGESISFEADGDKTKVIYLAGARVRFYATPVVPILKRRLRGQIEGALSNLARLPNTTKA